MSWALSCITYLDEKGHAKTEDLERGSSLLKAISKLQPIRDIEWTGDKPAFVRSRGRPNKMGALHGQRCGTVLSQEDSCGHCLQENGRFKGCVIVDTGDVLDRPFIGNGSCMNCYFTLGCRCSLRQIYFKLGPGPFREKYCSQTNDIQAGRNESQIQVSNQVPQSSPRPPPVEHALQYLDSKKRKREPEYDNKYYHSPLEESDINGDGNFTKKRQALESIHSVYEHVLHDIGRLFNSLSEANELNAEAGSEENADDLPCEKPKVGVEAAQENDTPKRAPVKANEGVENTAFKTRPKKEEEDQKPIISTTSDKTEHTVKIEKEQVDPLATGTQVNAKRKVTKERLAG